MSTLPPDPAATKAAAEQYFLVLQPPYSRQELFMQAETDASSPHHSAELIGKGLHPPADLMQQQQQQQHQEQALEALAPQLPLQQPYLQPPPPPRPASPGQLDEQEMLRILHEHMDSEQQELFSDAAIARLVAISNKKRTPERQRKLAQDNLTAMAVNAAGKEFKGNGRPPVRDPATSWILGMMVPGLCCFIKLCDPEVKQRANQAAKQMPQHLVDAACYYLRHPGSQCPVAACKQLREGYPLSSHWIRRWSPVVQASHADNGYGIEGCFLRRHLREVAAALNVGYEKVQLLEACLGQAVPPRPRPPPPDRIPSFDEWALQLLRAEARMVV